MLITNKSYSNHEKNLHLTSKQPLASYLSAVLHIKIPAKDMTGIYWLLWWYESQGNGRKVSWLVNVMVSYFPGESGTSIGGHLPCNPETNTYLIRKRRNLLAKMVIELHPNFTFNKYIDGKSR